MTFRKRLQAAIDEADTEVFVALGEKREADAKCIDDFDGPTRQQCYTQLVAQRTAAAISLGRACVRRDTLNDVMEWHRETSDASE